MTQTARDAKIHDFITQKFPGDTPEQKAKRQRLIQACTSFVASGLADQNFVAELTSGEEPKFWGRVSEALIARQLQDKIFPRRNRIGIGPDLLVMDGQRKVWIEIICPVPTQIPSDWLEPEPNSVITFPHEEILLRWTSAIKEKAEKLLGSSRNPNGYLASGMVAANDAYVIAVNACMLRSGSFSTLDGISGRPFAAEAVFGFGAFQITIHRETLKALGTDHQHRPFVRNRNDADVPTYMFLDPAFKAISAIWAVDLNGDGDDGQKPMYVIHNPNATSAISTGFLPSLHDYVAKRDGDRFVLYGVNAK